MLLADLHARLAKLEADKNRIENEIVSVKQAIEKQSPFSKADKIALFRQLFIGNEDVYAKRWISRDGLKKGYSPVPKTFRGNDWLPVSDTVIRQHLEGKERYGTYAVKNQSFCCFLASTRRELPDEVLVGIPQYVAVVILQFEVDGVEMGKHLGNQ